MSTAILQAGQARGAPRTATARATAGGYPAVMVGAGAGGTPVDRDAQLQRAVRQAAHLRRGFYLVVLLVALAGQVSGAQESLHLRPLAAIPAVAALELGGMVILSNADVRRQLGERAIGSRILSAAIAAGAVWFNATAHHDHLVGGFFASMSGLGYLVWLTHTENTRRDRLRATGDLPPTTPAYEVLGHWLRHPWLTQRARSLAKADPTLGLYGSLTAATQQREQEHRRTTIAAILHRKVHAAVDQDTAAIAVAVYDLDEIARQLAARADYTTLTDLIAADLQPDRLAGQPRSAAQPALTQTSTLGGATPPAASDGPAAAEPGAGSMNGAGSGIASIAGSDASHATAGDDGLDAATRSADREVSSDEGGRGADDSAKSTNSAPPNTAAAVAYWHRQDPALHPAQIGERIGRSERTVRRYWPPSPEAESGTDQPAERGQPGTP